MLKQRVLTAMVLIPLVLLILFFAPHPTFAAITAMVMLLGAWEWTRLMEFRKTHQRIAWVIFIAVLLMLLYRLEFLAQPILILGAVWWILITLTISYLIYKKIVWKLPVWFVGLSCLFSLVPCWVALNAIREIPHGTLLLLLLLLCVWGADTGAYFAGKQWGQRKLAPLISPSKSWEGVGGALVAVIIISGISGHVFLGAIIVVMTVVGDLFESLLKRGCHIKDSGGLLPGHGGILDRIDGLMAAAPIFALGIMLI